MISVKTNGDIEYNALGGGYGCGVLSGEGLVELGSGPGGPLESGVAVGSGAFRRQIGRFMFGVGEGVGGASVGFGLNFRGGIAVGKGSGGTRGSGKTGSSGAEITTVRFQFGPYGEALF
jgi:hypothetical protein